MEYKMFKETHGIMKMSQKEGTIQKNQRVFLEVNMFMKLKDSMDKWDRH